MVRRLGRVRPSQPARMAQQQVPVRVSQPVRGERPDLEAGPSRIVRHHPMTDQAGHRGEWLRAAHRLKVVRIVRHRAIRGRRVVRIVRHRAIRDRAHPGQEVRAGLAVVLQVVAVLLGQATVGGHKMEMDAQVVAQAIAGLHPVDQLAGRAGLRLR